jgi:tetratricopeptide (TPR) repeat protein
MHGLDAAGKHGTSGRARAQRGLPRMLGWRARIVWVCAVAMAFVPLSNVVVVSGGAAAAQDDRPRRVLMVRTQAERGVSPMVVNRIAGYMDSILPLDKRLEFVRAQALSPAEAPEAKATGRHARTVAKGTLDRAEKSVEDARKQAQRRKWDAAIREYTKALTLYAKEIAQLTDLRPYHEAVVERALAYLEAGYDDNAEEEFLRALAFDPGLKLPPSASPAAQATLMRASSRVQPAPGKLTVTVDPAGATVVVDGRISKAAPAEFEGLPRGEHVVQVFAPDYQPHARIVTVYDTFVPVAVKLSAMPGVTPRPLKQPPAGTMQAPAEAATGLEAFAQSGEFGADFQTVAKQLAKNNALDAIVISYVRRKGKGFELGMVVWSASYNRVAQVASAELPEDLSGLQIAVLDVSEPTVAAVVDFPVSAVSNGKPPIYVAEAAVAAVVPGGEPKPGDGAVKPPDKTPGGGTVMDGGGPVTRGGGKTPLELDPVVVVKPGGGAAGTPGSAPLVGPPGVIKKPEPESEKPEFYETWWFWTLTIGLVAGGTTAAVLASEASAPASGFKTRVSW